MVLINIKKKNILITGGSGFLARNIAKKLYKNNNVYLFSRNIDNLKNVTNLINCNIFSGDIARIESLRDVFNIVKFDIVIHTAATKYVDFSELNPNECIDTNIIGTQNVVRVCNEYKVKSLVAISSDKAASPHNNLYSLSKTFLERYISLSSQIYSTKMVCVRFGNIAWSTGSVFPIWHKMSKKNKHILTTGPRMKRYIFSVDEASDNVLLALKNINKLNGKILIQEMKFAKIQDILSLWCKHYGCTYKESKRRVGDKDNEVLISSNELDKITNKFTFNHKIFYILDIFSKNKKVVKKEISTQTSLPMLKKDILEIIKFEQK